MARIRSIHPGLTSDESYMSMSMVTKAAWTPLWMQCDDHGIFEWKPIVLKALIFPADNVDFGEVLDELQRLDCVRRIDIGGKPHGIVRNFAKYQRPKNPSYRHFKPEELPADLTEYICVRGKATPALPQPYPSPTEISPQMKEEGGSKEEEGKEEKKEEKKDAASAAPSSNHEADYFRRVKEICGPSSGGLAKKLLVAKNNSIPQARAAAEQASEKSDPREYLGAIIRSREEPECRPDRSF